MTHPSPTRPPSDLVARRGGDRIAGVDENGWVRGHGGAASLPVGAGLSSIENGVIYQNVNVIYHHSDRSCKRASRGGRTGSTDARLVAHPWPLPAPHAIMGKGRRWQSRCTSAPTACFRPRTRRATQRGRPMPEIGRAAGRERVGPYV